jgi:hydrogenase nickel incorporation protein HypA/HybF
MHEFSIASKVVETVLAYAKAHGVKKVVEVRMTIGELTCVEADQLKFCFGAITKHTALEDSALEIDIADAAVRCRHCGYEGSPKYWEGAQSAAFLPTLECPTCGQTAEPIAGHDCAIKSIKYVRESDPADAGLLPT